MAITPEEFVTTWQGCGSAAEARERLGPMAVYRAIRYRKRGIPLQYFTGGARRLDVAALKKLAQDASHPPTVKRVEAA